jgi:hypothetical protein
MEWLTLSFTVSGLVLGASSLASFCLMAMVLMPETKEDGIRIVRDDHATAWMVTCGIGLAIAGVAAFVEPGNWGFFIVGVLGGLFFGLTSRWIKPD